MQDSATNSTTSNWKNSIVSFLLICFVRFYALFIRIEVRDKQGLFKSNEEKDSVIFALWHDRLLLLALTLVKYKIAPNRLVALASSSKAGIVASNLFTRLNMPSIHISKRYRGQLVALKEMQKQLSKQTNALITPDGSNGPAFVVKPGLIRLAKASNKNILPINIYASNVWRLKNIWDHHVIPKPFSRVLVEISTEVSPQELDANHKALSEQQSYIGKKIINDIAIPNE